MTSTASQNTDIMIVDDVPDNLHLLSGMLRRHGYKIRALPSGKMALQSALIEPPHLILLDINMPQMNGYEVCEKLKENNTTKDVPVIFISALTETLDKVKAFETGGVDYITKPFQVEEILARISTHLEIRSLQQNLRRHNENLQQLVQDQVKEIADAQLSTIIAIVKLAEARDDDTGQHIERTRTFCKMTAEYLLENDIYVDEIDSSFIESIHTACPLHDIGKIAIPDSILLKPAKLTPEEFEIMKTHTTQGAQNLRMVQKKYPHNEFINMGICIAQSHHEKWNGSGYPHGLKGQDIPLAARIMALADVYDALRSKRVYKDAFSHEKSKEIITAGKGTHFDPNIIDTFLALESEFNRIRQEMDQ